MRVLVLNGSPAGENSITLYTVKYIERHFPGCSFEVLHVGQQIRKLEREFDACAARLLAADMILFCYPVYTFLVPAQLHRFVELMKTLHLAGKYAVQITTSKHFYDVSAHRFIQDNCDDMGLRYAGGLSADMDDLLTDKGRREALSFFARAIWRMEQGHAEPPLYRAPNTGAPRRPASPEAVVPTSPADRLARKVVIVTDLDPEAADEPLRRMIDRFQAVLPAASEVVNLRQFPFAGGCLGCFNCASDGRCVYRDGFDDFLRRNIQTADAIVYAYAIRDHSMGYRFKLYDDRQFCNGHRTVTMGKPVGYLVHGALDGEPNLRMLMEARAQVGGNHLAGIATDQHSPAEEIDQLAAQLGYALEHDYQEPRNFYGVGGLKIFRDLIYQMRGMMKADHRFYRQNGFYDFPQKRRGRILGMYAVGAMMNSRSLRRKIGGRMTEGMVMPYRKALEKEPIGAGKTGAR